MKRLQVVDLVRAVAILLVLAVHLGSLYITRSSQPHSLVYLWYKIWINGGYGVSMFFVVSGFVITRLIANQPGGLFNPDYRNFYIRRIGRILPLLVLVSLVGIGMMAWFPSSGLPFEHIFKDPQVEMGPGFFLSIATFSFNWYEIFNERLHTTHFIGLYWSVLWTLAIEEQFYFFYPFVLKRLGNERNLAWFLAALVIFGPFSSILFDRLFPGYFSMSRNSFGSFGLIAMGCLLYLISNRYGKLLSKKRQFFLCLLGLVIVAITYWHNNVRVDYYWIHLGSTYIGIGVFFFLLGGLQLEWFESKKWSFPARLGQLSYGAYLYHSLILYLLWSFLMGKNDFGGFFLLAAAIFGLSEISYRYFEIPMNLFIRKALGNREKE